jgi:DNA ligase-1
MTGALLVQTPDGKQFSLGSGLTAQMRKSPPALGSWVTYRYQGLHEKSGLPRFARFCACAASRAFSPSRQARDSGFIAACDCRPAPQARANYGSCAPRSRAACNTFLT